jgi:hypothetical protein
LSSSSAELAFFLPPSTPFGFLHLKRHSRLFKTPKELDFCFKD